MNAAGTRSQSLHSSVRRSPKNTASTHLMGSASRRMLLAVSNTRPSGRFLSTLKYPSPVWLYRSESITACAASSRDSSGGWWWW